MKKVLALFAILGFLFIGINTAMAQTPDTAKVDTNQVINNNNQDAVEDDAADTEVGIHSALKTKFIEGGPGFMATILLCLIFGLGVALERVIYLTLATTNVDKLLVNVEKALDESGVEAAKEVCRNTRGPVASIFYQGFLRYEHGIDVVEKTIVSYGGVQMGLMERGLTWIALFIALAPMLGFLGTVIGMVGAFDAIEKAGDISPTIVAGGIKIALITTVFGLIVAIILQLFYNYITSRVDALVTKMEDASVTLIDIIYKHNLKTK